MIFSLTIDLLFWFLTVTRNPRKRYRTEAPRNYLSSHISADGLTASSSSSVRDKLRPLLHPLRWYLLQFDGGSRGNPGDAGAGAALFALCQEYIIGKGISGRESLPKQEVWNGTFFLGKTTNNTAEYQALIEGLKAANELGIQVRVTPHTCDVLSRKSISS